MNNRNVEDDPTTTKQNCMVPPFSQSPSPSQSTSSSLQSRKIRKVASLQSMGNQVSVSKRDVSISTMMGNLTLDERAYESFAKRSRRSQVISNKNTRPSALASAPVSLRHSSDQLGSVTFRRSFRREATAQLCPQREDPEVSTRAAPLTPRSHSVQEAQQMLDDFEASLMASTRKCTGSPSKSTPKVRSFLTKDSNTRAFTAWDVDERLIELDSQFKAMKEVMNVSLSDKKAMEEVIDMAKTRGKAPELTATCICDWLTLCS